MTRLSPVDPQLAGLVSDQDSGLLLEPAGQGGVDQLACLMVQTRGRLIKYGQCPAE